MKSIHASFSQHVTQLGLVGRTGEKISRQIVFDCRKILEEYPDAVISCILQREGDEAPYEVTPEKDGTNRILVLSKIDVAIAGTIQIELRAIGDAVRKSAFYQGYVAQSMEGEGDAPESPLDDVLNRLAVVEEGAKDATTLANEAAENANAKAEAITDAVERAEQAVTQASAAVEKAAEAVSNADQATKKASEAATKAEEASTKANASATNADEASMKANHAASSAEESATKAESAATEATNKVSEMETLMKNVDAAMTDYDTTFGLNESAFEKNLKAVGQATDDAIAAMQKAENAASSAATATEDAKQAAKNAESVSEAVQTAEAERTKAETARASAESSRETAEAERVESFSKIIGETGELSSRVQKIEDDYLTSADKESLTSAIEKAKEDAILSIMGSAGVDEKYDTLKEIADWILSDTTASAELVTRVSNIEKDYLKGADKTEIEKKISEVSERIGTLPSGASTVVAYIQEAIAALNIGDYAKADALTALAERVTTAENNLTEEAKTRALADTTLQGNIDSEASARAAADEKLSTRIEEVAQETGITDDTTGTVYKLGMDNGYLYIEEATVNE